MDKDFFMNSSIPPLLQHDHSFSWKSLANSMEIPTTQSQDYFICTPPQNDHFESALSSMVSSPTASNSAMSTDNFMIRELIGKLDNICNYSDIPNYINNGNCSTNNSCYSTPLSSPPKISRSMPIINHMVQENFPSLGNSTMGLSSNLPSMPGDPGFAERAARFSSFGSRSQLKLSNDNLQRVYSSSSLKLANGSQLVNNNNINFMNERKHSGNSTIPGQNQEAEIGSNRKRKASSSKGKGKVGENGSDLIAKRSKSEKINCKKGGAAKAEENKGEYDHKKPNEPPKDYIHVRARRGQATDSHSLAERVRREKISERMKLLRDIVPGCNRVIGKALMLDEIINYVQSLQRQVEFLSMKLSTENPRLELNMNNLSLKDEIQPNCSLAHPMYTTMVPNLYGQPHQNPSQDSLTTTEAMDPLNHTLNYNHVLHFPSIEGHSNYLSQLQSPQSKFQMGFGQKENEFEAQTSLHGTNTTQMKIEF